MPGNIDLNDRQPQNVSEYLLIHHVRTFIDDKLANIPTNSPPDVFCKVTFSLNICKGCVGGGLNYVFSLVP